MMEKYWMLSHVIFLIIGLQPLQRWLVSPNIPPFLSSFLRTLFPAHRLHRTLLATGTSKQRTSERVSSHEARIEGAIDLHPVDNGRTEDDD